MENERNTYIHFIEEKTGDFISKQLVSNIPRLGDELRFSSKGNDVYYKVNQVVWVYDEPECPYERVNIGVI